MFPKEIQTSNDIINYISNNISNDYIESCFEVISSLADGYLIHYDDLAEIKIAQRFLRHSELLLAKTLTYYLIQILNNNGYNCVHNKYNTFYIHGDDKYVHILDFDKFMSLQKFTDGKSKNLYVIIAQETEDVNYKITRFNDNLEKSKIITLKNFVLDCLNKRIWDDYFTNLFINISKLFNEKKVFGITKIYSSKSANTFKQACLKTLSLFDYKNKLKNESIVINSKSFESIIKQFEKNKKILVENMDFANSYITSEWLYQNLLKENDLDKTFIVSGYLKSIEQLLFHYAQTKGKNIYIHKSGKFTKTNPKSYTYIKSTLGNLAHLLDPRENCFMPYISDSTITQIRKLLMDWIQKERNGYFHKKNINDNEVVIYIRERTYLLYFFLLGSLKDIY